MDLDFSHKILFIKFLCMCNSLQSASPDFVINRTGGIFNPLSLHCQPLPVEAVLLFKFEANLS